MRTIMLGLTASAAAGAARRRQARHWLQHALDGCLATLTEWRHRSRTRGELAKLDERMLRDIGITRVDAWREANKPFWRS